MHTAEWVMGRKACSWQDILYVVLTGEREGKDPQVNNGTGEIRLLYSQDTINKHTSEFIRLYSDIFSSFHSRPVSLFRYHEVRTPQNVAL